MTNLEALKALYAQLGGTEEAVADATTTLEVLNAISAIYDGESGTQNANAIDEISKVATGGGGGNYKTQNVTITIDDRSTNVASGKIAEVQYFGVVDGKIDVVTIPVNKGATTVNCDAMIVGGYGYMWFSGVQDLTTCSDLKNYAWLNPTYGGGSVKTLSGAIVYEQTGENPTPCYGTLQIDNQTIS